MMRMEERSEKVDLNILGGYSNYDTNGHKTGHSNLGILGNWNHYDD